MFYIILLISNLYLIFISSFNELTEELVTCQIASPIEEAVTCEISEPIEVVTCKISNPIDEEECLTCIVPIDDFPQPRCVTCEGVEGGPLTPEEKVYYLNEAFM